MSIKIEKNIPFEKPSKNRKYPFGKMQVGDSFISHEEYTHKRSASVVSSANYFRKNTPGKLDWKFAVRKVEGNKIRVWRIK